jgi:YhcH/YjgK/YiaL family protein
MQTRAAYSPERDLITYEDTPDASCLRVFPGQAAVFFPADAHMPTLRVRDAGGLVRKSVIKIPVA